MHARTVVALATLAAAPLAAQRSHSFEFGVFGSFTRYDHAFNLDNQIGGGGRLGYFFGEHMGVELDAGYQAPSAKTGPAASKLSVGSASLVLNFGSERNTFYLLGGYSRLDFEDSTPYRFTDNAMHGALGDRIFLGDRVAMRLEVRAIYAPSTKAAFGPDWAGHIIGTLGLSAFFGGEARDLDGDGVADNKDACPGTPTGAVVDPRGCPTDADGDAVCRQRRRPRRRGPVSQHSGRRRGGRDRLPGRLRQGRRARRPRQVPQHAGRHGSRHLRLPGQQGQRRRRRG